MISVDIAIEIVEPDTDGEEGLHELSLLLNFVRERLETR